jgi:hypothetical protein
MPRVNVAELKLSSRATISNNEKLLVGRHEAAKMLSISCRAVDYLVSSKQLIIRRIGSRVLIPVSALERYCSSDHPESLAG